MSFTMNESVGITIDNVGLRFGNTEVLKGVNMEIKPGEFFAFLGPSGSGKSTLLRAIAGFGPTPSGRILIGDEDVTKLPPHKRNVGMVFQSYALWPHMTVRKNVAFGLEERRVPKNQIDDLVDEALDLVGLKHLADRRPSQLSGGQQQRIALARTIVVKPRVLLLDEPLSNLDANLRVQMRRDILALQRKLGLTTIFVTHDQEEANTTSDRIAVLNEGVIQQMGAPVDLYDRPANRFVASFLGTANILDGAVDAADGTPCFRSNGKISIPVTSDVQGDACLVFRPQNAAIHQAGVAPKDGEILLQGAIRDREFLGNVVRYGVAVGDHYLLVDDIHQNGHSYLEPGTAVELTLPADRPVVLGKV
ncbi:ABC transporter ATP-binding protein [Aestuariispira ectoiniformans]|uniref:ABC transporter ATP-binding protein n=1 Tax=Aestuariispira ectoiniformans TaxID=2775080 RepID=UPI00223B7531|nr:ABC transporter ATP-binding protein [Aestuariispira ectoiniformans]